MRSRLNVLMVMVFAAGCAWQGAVKIPDSVPELRPGILQGYLAPEMLPDSFALLPPPPAEGSAALALDREMSEKALALQGSPRFDLAAADAVLRFPDAVGTFACAIGVPITEQDTPNLYMLLRRSLTDAGLSTYAAKNRYQRTRPFVVNGQPTCTPQEEAMLSNDGSYPSGHSALGWAWALILAELVPDRSDAILARGRAFSESRVICNVHWYSDVEEGRFMGSAAVARLHGDPVFRAQVDKAREEVEKLRVAGAVPVGDCEAEAKALKGIGLR
ncbi:MAG: phosphatase PAP2 family protein [Pseudomonadales bacterium]